MVKVTSAATPPLPPLTPLPPAAPLRENCADTAPTGAVDALYPQPKDCVTVAAGAEAGATSATSAARTAGMANGGGGGGGESGGGGRAGGGGGRRGGHDGVPQSVFRSRSCALSRVRASWQRGGRDDEMTARADRVPVVGGPGWELKPNTAAVGGCRDVDRGRSSATLAGSGRR